MIIAVYKCPKCGKQYKNKGAYYQKHIESCAGKQMAIKTKKKVISPKSTQASLNIIKRLEKIEHRIDYLEQDLLKLKLNRKSKSEINNEKRFFEIINQKINELSKKNLGIQKVLLSDLFEEINKQYYISLENFSKYLIKLNNLNKIQLESGFSADNFSVKDNYGNIFKIIRIID
ncbi:MAG: hypothetical protein ACFFAO_20475 [Candidatus Hermodarchaeota archaeon]